MFNDGVLLLPVLVGSEDRPATKMDISFKEFVCGMKLHNKNINSSTTANFELMDANTNDLSTDLMNNTDGIILSHNVMNDAVASMPNNTSRRDDRLVLPNPPRHTMAGNAAGNDLSRNIPVPLAPYLSGRDDKESLERSVQLNYTYGSEQIYVPESRVQYNSICTIQNNYLCTSFTNMMRIENVAI